MEKIKNEVQHILSDHKKLAIAVVIIIVILAIS